MQKIFINIEGNDGTGKKTISEKLYDMLSEKYGCQAVYVCDFPNYDSPTGNLVKQFLDGELFGDPTKVDPYKACLPYIMDRLTYYYKNKTIFENPDIKIFIFNRSYMSNYFYHASKIVMNNTELYSEDLLEDLNMWIETMYHTEIQNSPLYNNQVKTFYIHTSDIQDNIDQMKHRGNHLDLHERNVEYLKSVEEFAMRSMIDDLGNDPYANLYQYEIIETHHGSTLQEINKIVTSVASTIYDKIVETLDRIPNGDIYMEDQ